MFKVAEHKITVYGWGGVSLDIYWSNNKIFTKLMEIQWASDLKFIIWVDKLAYSIVKGDLMIWESINYHILWLKFGL